MATIEDKKKELMKLMMQSLAVTSDEAEGTQVTNIDDIHGCNTDYIDYEEPKLTAAQIASMLHLNDFSPIRDRESDNLSDYPGKGPQVSTDSAAGAPTDGSATPAGDDRNAPGTNSNPLSGDKSKEPSDEEHPQDTGYDNIKIPDDVELDDIVNAIINDDSVGPTRAIVEFAQPCIRDEKGVDFKFLVKPGEQINENTIIAQATIDGKNKFVRSIFGKGQVVATDDGSDFKHLYKGYGANRHIIIDNYVISGGAPEIDTESIEKIQDIYKEEACLHDLIINNLCESVLPHILLKRYDMLIPFMPPRDNGREIFSDYMDYVNDIRERYQRDMRRMATEDAVKETNGNVKKMDALAWRIINRRKQFVEELVYAYSEYKNTLPPCEYDLEYSDCQYLACVHSIKQGEQDTTLKFGDESYFNYYIVLLTQLNSDMSNEYTDKYRTILEDIIRKRMIVESYKLDTITKEFNELYRRIVSGRYWNWFDRLDKAMNETGGEVEYSDVSAWIGQTLSKRQDEYTQMQIRMLANMYMFARNYREWTNKMREQQGKSFDNYIKEVSKTKIFDLVKEENEKLEEFWSEVLAKYLGMSVQDCIDKTTEFIDKANAYAAWPSSTQIKYNDEYYDLYLFQNRDTGRKKMEPDGDVDYGIDPKDDIPEAPDPFQPPEITPDDVNMTGPDNIQEGEISITDFDYWKKYFALATIISLPFLNCGLDIPPFVMMIPLPCIFIALACTYIQPLDLVLVVGLSIRGMYIWPVFLYVNCSQMPLSIMTPLISQVKSIKSKISAKINGIAELSVGSIADGFISMVENDSRELRRQNKQLETLINQIQVKKANNQEAIKKRMDKLFKPDCKTTQQIIDPIGTINSNR